jgi:hypothetical protein
MLEEANDDIRRSLIEEVRRQEAARRPGQLIRAIDRLLFDLEDLNLLGVDRVPARLRERSSHLLEHVPEAEVEGLRVRQRVMPLMDVLFRAQELIFRKQNPRRQAKEEDDAEESA